VTEDEFRSASISALEEMRSVLLKHIGSIDNDGEQICLSVNVAKAFLATIILSFIKQLGKEKAILCYQTIIKDSLEMLGECK